jgi:Predicted ATPase
MNPVPFVDRAVVRDRLRGHLTRARNGAGRLVLFAGEPGIGKTRTAEEIASIARAVGFRTLQSDALETEAAPAFWPWTQILRCAIASFDRAILCRVAGPAAVDIAAMAPEMPLAAGETPSCDEGESARSRVFESVVQLLLGLSAITPLLLIFDDLHVADADSLLLLQFLAPRLRTAAILVIGTYRDVDVRREHALASTLANLARESHCERLELRGLEVSAVESIMEAVAGIRPSAALAAMVRSMGDGNPFFVRECTAFVVDEGDLGDALDDGELSLRLPQSLPDVIGRRLNTLSTDCNEMLRSASAFGGGFTALLLQRVCGDVERNRVMEWIDEALAAQMLVESGDSPGHYRFSHALVRQTLYLELSTPQRVRLHRQIGRVLETFYGARPDEHLTELAHHFVQAVPVGEIERAVSYCVNAGRRAHRQYAYEEEARHYERALELLELDSNADGTRRCELVLALGEMLMTAGDHVRGRSCLREAADLSQALGRWDLFGRAVMSHDPC